MFILVWFRWPTEGFDMPWTTGDRRPSFPKLFPLCIAKKYIYRQISVKHWRNNVLAGCSPMLLSLWLLLLLLGGFDLGFGIEIWISVAACLFSRLETLFTKLFHHLSHSQPRGERRNEWRNGRWGESSRGAEWGAAPRKDIVNKFSKLFTFSFI